MLVLSVRLSVPGSGLTLMLSMNISCRAGYLTITFEKYSHLVSAALARVYMSVRLCEYVRVMSRMELSGGHLGNVNIWLR